MTDHLPGRRIDRDALDRIIKRAAELQAGELDTGDDMTEAELLKLGKDVGIDGRFLRQALYEQSSGKLDQGHGTVGRMFGPTQVTASRVVAGEKAAIEEGLAHWMQEGEALAVKRRMPDRTVWEQQKGFFAQMKRGFGVGGRSYMLARALDVTVVVTQLEPGFCHVELIADVSMLRAGAMGVGFGVGASTIAVGLATILLLNPAGAPVLADIVGAVPVVAGGAVPFIAARVQRNRNGQMQLALEQVLDKLEHGEIKPRHRDVPQPFIRIAAEIRNAISDGIEQGKKRKKLGP